MRTVGGRTTNISADTRQARIAAAHEKDPWGFAFLSKPAAVQTLDEQRRTRYVVEGTPRGWLSPAQSYDMQCKHDHPECTDSDCLRPTMIDLHQGWSYKP